MRSTTPLFPTYQAINTTEKDAQYLCCQHIPVTFDKNDTLKTLWNIHDAALKKHPKKTKSTPSLLDLKITIAEKLFQHCTFCEHRCGIDRKNTTGHCQIFHTQIASALLHHGEESFLVPSYTIFFSGCNLSCVFCQNHDISQHHTGYQLPSAKLATLINQQATQGAKNINLVGGEPTPHLFFILKTLQQCRVNLPIIWNSNMYCSTETMKLLNGIIDLYLTDFKFGNDHCAQRLAHVPSYFTIIKRNHLLAAKQTDMLIRHLLLPNHIDCCTKPILQFINRYASHIPLHLMNQYHPDYQAAQHQHINRPINTEEEHHALLYADQLNLTLL